MKSVFYLLFFLIALLLMLVLSSIHATPVAMADTTSPVHTLAAVDFAISPVDSDSFAGALRRNQPPAADPPPGDPLVNLAANVRRAVVIVSGTGPAPDREVTLSTGFAVDTRGGILTCSRCVTGLENLTVRLTEDSRPLEAVLVSDDPSRDLALLYVRTNSVLNIVRFNFAPLRAGEEVYSWGHPEGYTYSLSSGDISSDRLQTIRPANRPEIRVFLHSNRVRYGCSGGPVFNRAGEIVGINVAWQPGLQGGAYAVPAPAIADFLRPSIVE